MKISPVASLSKSIWSAVLLPILILPILISGCGGKEAVAPESVSEQAFDDFRETIMEVIQDPERQAQVLSLVDDYESDYANLLTAVKTQRTELRRLNADYNASREQFQSYLDKYNAEILSSRKKAMESRATFVESTTTEEWDALSKADTKAMKKLVGTVQSI